MELNAEKDKLEKQRKEVVKPSGENWIPEISRFKSLERDLIVAKENLTDIILREQSTAREMKQFRTTDLQRAKLAEELRLAHSHKVECGCCLLQFLPCNLPLKVSQKAVLDIRIKWSGKLTSSTVFGGVNPSLSTNQEIVTATISLPESPPKPGKKTLIEKMAERLSALPRCYDDVPVCTFCAQFFHDQDEYRPSYLKITHEERKAVRMEAREREKAWWDPLKMVEKDREDEENAEKLAASASIHSSGAPGSSHGSRSLQSR